MIESSLYGLVQNIPKELKKHSIKVERNYKFYKNIEVQTQNNLIKVIERSGLDKNKQRIGLSVSYKEIELPDFKFTNKGTFDIYIVNKDGYTIEFTKLSDLFLVKIFTINDLITENDEIMSYQLKN
ncbi:hypothetical protein A0H76_1317 [Hepatospora eriocheir]|uniref:Uncharacterized protein n=1 Tax=Hepatospora eriocheir TaxID=1081669 RepID=A0A1X0QHL5_9MICR|nr:hypothetical protein A0H76_1317 [Hepatospora eriocheir]